MTFRSKLRPERIERGRRARADPQEAARIRPGVRAADQVKVYGWSADHVVQWTVHHIVTDGWSTGICYPRSAPPITRTRNGVEPELTPIKANSAVRDVASGLRGRRRSTRLDWWAGS